MFLESCRFFGLSVPYSSELRTIATVPSGHFISLTCLTGAPQVLLKLLYCVLFGRLWGRRHSCWPREVLLNSGSGGSRKLSAHGMEDLIRCNSPA